jgi:predicted MPP superfamily phosphohydrolase
MAGLAGRGARNTVAYRLEQVDVALYRLPRSLDGLRLLHLSDLHVDGMLDGGRRLREFLRGVGFDLCVLTGDYRLADDSDPDLVTARMTDLVSALGCERGIVAVLGNHDNLAVVGILEAAGVSVLLNEALPLGPGEPTLWLSGVDDPHFYSTHDLERALAPVPSESCTILLAHSPEIAAAAAAAGVDYCLCGHTHGGQICLPGGVAILKNAACPRRFVAGAWRYGATAGYTSRGAGFSMFPARFFCPPEVTLHRLIRR